jgi:hypothetical protein
MNRNSPTEVYPTGAGFLLIDRLLEPVLEFANSSTYHFLETQRFKELMKTDPVRGHQVYWQEILARAHWGSLVALLRHVRWHVGCKDAISARNFLSFAACLRGMIESAADIGHAFGAVPTTLAKCRREIIPILEGKPPKRVVLNPELEQLLIHFLYARKLEKNEAAPAEHSALTMQRYFQHVQGSEPPLLQKLYAFLCQVAHPSALSLMGFMACTSDGCTVQISTNADGDRIGDLCSEHGAAILDAVFQAVNPPLLTLKVLNRYPLREFHTPTLDGIGFEGIHAWTKIETLWNA